MRLVLDLRLRAVHDEHAAAGELRVRPQDLAARARRPGELVRLLGTRWESVRVLRDELPVNGIQAGAALLAGLARTERIDVERGGVVASYGRSRFLARAAVRLAVALPVEGALTVVALARTRRQARRHVRLARRCADPRRALYLYRPLTAMGSTAGGAAAHTTGVLGGLGALGVDIEVLGPQPPGGTDGGQFRAVPVRRRFHIVQWLTVAEYSRELAHAAATRSVDFVYERSIAGTYAGVEVARRLGVPLVLEFNGSEVWIAEHWGGRPLAAAGLAAALERRNLRSASLVVVLSQVLADQVERLGVDPARVVVNPVGADVEAMAPLRERTATEWRGRVGLEEAPTVAFIGTFGPWHGVELLPEMITRVRASRPDARWLLVGGGPLHAPVCEEVERLGLAPYVTLTGAVPRERALRLLACADVCVSPHVPNPDGSRFFGSPTKVFEYMALGRAIVASDLEQIGEVIRDGENGLLHPAGDAGAAAALVARLLADDQARTQLGAAALRDARERWSWSAHVRRTLAALARE